VTEGSRVKVGEIEVELRVDPKLAPSVLRAFVGRTSLDNEVDGLEVPNSPALTRMSVKLLRLYRRFRPASVGRRCVFDPSCSRYSELAFRKLGFVRGLVATISRLHRCGPGAGGIDIP
jgi:putative component of membrane protein insertase Oxa1/YidC/SpoIIIJ protein YidD